jgi:hypothetical protein
VTPGVDGGPTGSTTIEHRVVWTLWLQGRHRAPRVVRECLASWERHNPTWEIRCLDATTVGRYVDVASVVDLATSTITATSLSDVIRLLLLHEYGGVWVDATLYCNRPLDEWLEPVLGEGLFAFSRPAPDRLVEAIAPSRLAGDGPADGTSAPGHIPWSCRCQGDRAVVRSTRPGTPSAVTVGCGAIHPVGARRPVRGRRRPPAATVRRFPCFRGGPCPPFPPTCT